MPLTPSQRTLDEAASPSFCAGRKCGEVEQALVWPLLHEDPECPSRVLLAQVAHRQRPMAVRMRHRNRWRVTWPCNRQRGRPRQSVSRPSGPSHGEVVQVVPHLSFVGVHLLAHGLEHQGAFAPVVAQLQQAIEAHKRTPPDDDWALLPHREQTLLRRLQALFFAPLLGLEQLTACDTHAHPLPTRLGRGAHSATLTQLLGHLERIQAAHALLPALVPAHTGPITSVEGSMIAYGARRPLHKGQSTRLGRIMAGAQAVIAHHEAGPALFVAYSPPAMPLSPLMVASCRPGAMATGSALFVIDRAVHAVAMAGAFDAQGFGVLCLLDANEPHGLASLEAQRVDTLTDGTKG